MASLLFQITTGPENPTKVALGLLVAKTAASEGHDVTVFFAGDGVQLLRDATLDGTHGVGVGSAREHFDALSSAGATFRASGMSAKARGLTQEEVGDKAELVMPTVLVGLIVESDRSVVY